MNRIFEELNEMSFDLPQGWQVSTDKYNIMNGQGFINIENYITSEDKVVSFFQVQRDPDEFFEHYHNLMLGYDEKKDGIEFVAQFPILVNDFEFPVYFLKATREKPIYIVQIFINCGDCLGCLIFNIDSYDEDKKKLLKNNKIFKEATMLLRTVE